MDVAGRIHEANQRFMEAISAAHSATMPSLYTSDAKILPPNADAVSGADAIEEFWQAFFDLGIAAAQPETAGGDSDGRVRARGRRVFTVRRRRDFGGPWQDHGAVEERGRNLEDAPGHLEQQSAPARGIDTTNTTSEASPERDSTN